MVIVQFSLFQEKLLALFQSFLLPLAVFPQGRYSCVDLFTLWLTKITKAIIRISKSCVEVSYLANRSWSLKFHSLSDCQTLNNVTLQLVYLSAMLEFIPFFRHKPCNRNLYWYFNLHTVTTNLAHLSDILWCSFHMHKAASPSLNKTTN